MSCQNSRARWKIRETLGGPPVKSTNHRLSNRMPRSRLSQGEPHETTSRGGSQGSRLETYWTIRG